MSELTIQDLVTDLDLNLERLNGIVREVSEAVADGNLDGASLVLGTQTGKIGRFTDSYAALQRKLEEEGADYRRAAQPE